MTAIITGKNKRYVVRMREEQHPSFPVYEVYFIDRRKEGETSRYSFTSEDKKEEAMPAFEQFFGEVNHEPPPMYGYGTGGFVDLTAFATVDVFGGIVERTRPQWDLTPDQNLATRFQSLDAAKDSILEYLEAESSKGVRIEPTDDLTWKAPSNRTYYFETEEPSE